MTTCVLKRDPVWLASLPVGVTSVPIILLGEDDCQVAVPASLLLAVSPLVRRVLADLLPPAFSPCYLSLPVSKDVLKQVAEILSSGTVACEQEGGVDEVKKVIELLGIEPSLVCCDKYEDVLMGHVLDKNMKVEDESGVEIKMEITDNLEADITSAVNKEQTQNINNTIVNYDVIVKEDSYSDLVDKDERDLNFTRSEKKIQLIKTVSCHICSKQFPKKYLLKRHVDFVHKKIKVPCNLCPQGFSNMSHLTRHINNVHNKIEFPCRLCAQQFTNKSSLSQHMTTVHSYISCNLCPKIYSRKDKLLTHIKYVHNKTKLACNLCPQGFLNAGNLRRHIITVHEKEFSCSLCTKKYSRNDELLRHIKLEHLNEEASR